MSELKKAEKATSLLQDLLNEFDQQLNVLQNNSSRLHEISYTMRDHRIDSSDDCDSKSYSPDAIVDKLQQRLSRLRNYNSQLDIDITNLEAVV